MATKTPINFSNTPLTRSYSNFYATVLDNVFTPAECADLIALASSDEWKPARLNLAELEPVVQSSFRHSDRVIRIDADAATMIYERLKPMVEEIHQLPPGGAWPYIAGKPGKTQGPTWKLVGVNPRLSFLRYGPGHYFKPHCDGLIELMDGTQKSFVTLHIYLNDGDGLEGGATRFWTPDKKEFLDVEPKRGRVLVFQQRMLVHSGEEWILTGLYTVAYLATREAGFVWLRPECSFEPQALIIKPELSRQDLLPMENVTTLAYKTLSDGTPVYLDTYPPAVTDAVEQRATPGIPLVILSPAVVYFHGGGLTVGDRRSWLPNWLRKRANGAGYFFISPDYHLIPPNTGHAIVEDILDLFEFISKADLSECIRPHPIRGEDTTPTPIHRVDPNAIVAAGSSAGGLCAYLAAFHCISPKPKVILSIYGMGGDFLIPQYLKPKTEIWFRGRELLDPSGFLSYLHPYPSPPGLSELVGSPLAYHPESSPTPGYPANPRMLLARLYLQLGVFLDYYTAEHAPSLSGLLRQAVLEDSERTSTASIRKEYLQGLIPEHHRSIFPQFNVSSIWPPTILFHGSADSAVPISESTHLRDLLDAAHVPTHLIIAEGEEHSFDYRPGAEATNHQDFEMIMDLLKQYIRVEI